MTTNLIKMAQWLAKVEKLAYDCYQKAQEVPGLNSEFISFLQECAEEEIWHLTALQKAAPLLESRGDAVSDLKIDPEVIEQTEQVLKDTLEVFSRPGIGEMEVMESIVIFEFSEWNPIFIYVLERISEISGQVLYPSGRIEVHLRRIVDHAELIGFENDLLRRYKILPRFWEESILAVDDEESIRELLSGILRTQGRVDLASDGLEALELLKNHYYKVIVTDLKMPNLDGVGFYRKAQEMYPYIAERFIFLTGNAHLVDPEQVGIDQTTVLEKPFQVKELLKLVKVRLGKPKD